MQTYTIGKTIYYNSCSQQYENILTIDRIPEGNLRHHVRQIKENNGRIKNCCIYGFASDSLCLPNNNNKHKYLLVNEIPYFYSLILSNNYIINTKLTNMTNISGIRINPNLVCFITLNDKTNE